MTESYTGLIYTVYLLCLLCVDKLDIVHMLGKQGSFLYVCLIDAEDIDVFFSAMSLEHSLVEGRLSPFYEV